MLPDASTPRVPVVPVAIVLVAVKLVILIPDEPATPESTSNLTFGVNVPIPKPVAVKRILSMLFWMNGISKLEIVPNFFASDTVFPLKNHTLSTKFLGLTAISTDVPANMSACEADRMYAIFYLKKF